MSIVYITYHDENICDAEKNFDQSSEKLHRYISKFKLKVRNEFKTPDTLVRKDGVKILTSSVRSARKTMGYAETPLEPPCNFLRKNQGVKWSRLKEHVCPKGNRMPPVPKFAHPKTPKPKELPPTSKKVRPCKPNFPHPIYFRNHKHRANFVKLNKENTKKLQTKRPPPCYVDTPKGDRHNLLNAGLIPQYMCSKNFAKVPCYIPMRKKWLSEMRAKRMREEKKADDMCMGYLTSEHVRMLSLEERQEIVKGLKINYAANMKDYQSLSLSTDTISKKLHKADLEKNFRTLEQDILLLESNQDIFITDH